MSVELTDRGLKSILAVVVVFVLGLALRDFVLLGIPIVFGFFMYNQYRMLRSALGRYGQIFFTPDKVEDNVIAGSTYSGPIQVYSPLTQTLELISGSDIESFEPGTVGSGESVFTYSISPVLSEVHKSQLSGCIRDNYRLLSARGKLEFNVVFNVYPRVFPVAVAAIHYLLGAGSFGEIEAPITKRGRGGEYAYTRQYDPGDPLNLFDWKAYAKTGKPMVKEYYDEAGGGVNIVYDPIAFDPVSLDELNTEFLKTVLTYAQSKTPIKLHKLEKNNIKKINSNQLDALTTALKISLEYEFEDFFEYYTLLEPTRAEKIRKILGLKTPNPVNVDPLIGEVIIVSSLQGNPANLIDMIRNMPRVNTRIIQPTKKWLYTQDLNKSVRIYLDNSAKTKILEKIGIKIYQDIIEAEPWLIEVH